MCWAGSMGCGITMIDPSPRCFKHLDIVVNYYSHHLYPSLYHMHYLFMQSALHRGVLDVAASAFGGSDTLRRGICR